MRRMRKMRKIRKKRNAMRVATALSISAIAIMPIFAEEVDNENLDELMEEK